MQLLDKDCNVIHEPERQFNLHRIHKNQDTISEVEMNAVLKSPLFGSMDKQDACFQEEAIRVKEEVVNWIDSVSELYNMQHPDFSFKAKLRGSMCENTKCGPADEFDFMLVMDGLTKHYKVEKKDFSCVHLSLAGSTTSKRPSKIESDDPLHHFNETFHAVIMKSETWKKTSLKFVLFRTMRVGVNIVVAYNGFLHKHLTISIDLVPCFPLALDVHPPENRWPVPLDYSQCRCYAMLEKYADSPSWPKLYRVSYTDYEQEIMKSIPQAAKNAYIVTKATWSQADNRRDHKPSSYQLKTTLFVSCAKMLRNEEDVDGVSVAEWARMIYDSKFDKLEREKQAVNVEPIGVDFAKMHIMKPLDSTTNTFAPLMLSCVSAFNQFHNRKRRCEPTISDIKIRCQSLLLAGHKIAGENDVLPSTDTAESAISLLYHDSRSSRVRNASRERFDSLR
ncbi:hypothetical protein CAPTEDRAFT_214501 [Capitella teleta]|uniref:Uncharacterized protein n=1 Tax=Capitella teleta TaxID=283909 RepID=R7UL84_CAPTE|nr:hypothetical protein CAPTEDRAFT_214501 [Capitella teleta]|eukprot:ELU04002.1 hypothetical protein CAPTEDRAFT_214501 [Capitella teleta]